MLPLDLARLRVYKIIPFVIKKIEHRINLYIFNYKKFGNLLKKNYHWICHLWIIFDTDFIPLQNEPSPILVGPKLGEE